MTTIQRLTDENETFSAIPQAPFHWLRKKVTPQALNLWTYLLLAPPDFLHHPDAISAEFDVSNRSIQRYLRELLHVGAIRRVTREQSGAYAMNYYRVVTIPRDYRQEKMIAAPQKPILAPPPKMNDAPPPVDNSCKQPEEKAVQKTSKTTDMSPLIRLSKIYSKNTSESHTHSHSIRGVQNLTDVNEQKVTLQRYRELFNRFLAEYPVSKIPYGNPSYLEACFRHFRFQVQGDSLETVEAIVDLIVNDVQFRLKNCYHWAHPDSTPSVFIYLKQARWRLPVEMHHAAREEARNEFTRAHNAPSLEARP